MKRMAMIALVSAAAVGCQGMKDRHDHDKLASDSKKMSTAAMASATAEVKPASGTTTQPSLPKVMGEVTFTQTAEGVKVHGEFKGLTPGASQAVHLHEKGDLSAPDLSSAGGHFNPATMHHGGTPAESGEHRHAGDLGNLKADDKGNATLDVTLPGLTLEGDKPNSIVGKSVIVHAKQDDLKSDPAGNSGGRIAGGVIEAKK